MKKTLQLLWNTFCMICTCILIAVAVFTTLVDPADSITPNILWQILLVSLLCALSTLLYRYSNTNNRKELIIRIGFHYLLINVIVLASGALFEWYRPSNLGSLLTMLAAIAIIFVAISIISWYRSTRDAKILNEKLAQYQGHKSPDR